MTTKKASEEDDDDDEELDCGTVAADDGDAAQDDAIILGQSTLRGRPQLKETDLDE
jgi:hypothetical protein